MPEKSFVVVAEMAFIHVGTKYIKRPWDFENFLEFWCTLDWCPQKQPKLTKMAILRFQWSQMVRTAWNEVGTGFGRSKSKFLNQFGGAGRPKIWPRGTQKQPEVVI